jgi:ABC-2 type transport system permease protein
VKSAGLVWHQTALEQRSFWRNPQTAFFTFALPVGLLVIFGAVAGNHAIPRLHGLHAPVVLVPGFLAFGIIVAAYQNLAATITLLRSEGVLKRIRSTPLQPGAYVAAHLCSGVVTCVALAAVTVTLGAAVFGAAPLGRRSLLLVGVLVLGVTCFASLGLAITAAIPTADAAGPVTNGTYLPLAIVSGTFSYDLVLPAWLNRIAALFPVKAFTDALRTCYNPIARATPTTEILVLAAWTFAGVVLTRRYFRWEP